jgi:molybdenum cofactor cytidylyltransferase
LGAAQIGVVCAPGHTPVTEELVRLGFPAADRILNPSPEAGMFSSIQCAARWRGWRRDLSHCVITLGDQPQLQPATLRKLLDHARAYPDCISQPSRAGRARHPVLLPWADFLRLGTCASQNLREFLQACAERVLRCESDDPGLDLDLDTPADYERALRLFLGGSQSGQS